MIRKLKIVFINYLTKKLLKTVSEDDILRITSKGFLYKKRKLGSDEVATLKEEAKVLSDSILWKLMIKEVEFMAFITMTEKATKPDDIIFGKAVFYATHLMKKFLEGLKNN